MVMIGKALLATFEDAEAAEDNDEKFIKALLDNPGSTDKYLSAAVSFDYEVWAQSFANMCKRRMKYLIKQLDKRKGESNFVELLVDHASGKSPRIYTMKHEFVEAFRKLGY